MVNKKKEKQSKQNKVDISYHKHKQPHIVPNLDEL